MFYLLGVLSFLRAKEHIARFKEPKIEHAMDTFIALMKLAFDLHMVTWLPPYLVFISGSVFFFVLVFLGYAES